MTVPARRELVRFAQARGLSERRALKLIGMSPSVLRYERRDDGNGQLRKRIVALAQRHLLSKKYAARWRTGIGATATG